VTGHVVPLLRTDGRHLEGSRQLLQPEAPTESFGRLLFKAFGRVNDMQINSSDLAQRMITDPGSVNVHDITIAMAEANLSLSMARSISDRAIKAYREIISIR
jgi:flagellar hook-basal body complex protein FliE